MKFPLFCALSFFGSCVLFAATPELVTVGDAGNAGKKVAFHEIRNAYPRGGVSYPYRIGKSEVSNAEYAAFLNACAVKSDPHKLWNEQMKIVRQNGRYLPSPGSESEGVAFVSRVNAARYCNYLTSGDIEKGAYVIAPRIRENGKTFDAIVGYRDLTFPEAARVYYLPDMHEFYKAGWYDGKGAYRELTAETRGEASHYGVLAHASGLREHMENKYYAGAPFVLGASDADKSVNDFNTVQLWQQAEYEGKANAGFRVAATAPLQIGDRLNQSNNFFFDKNEKAFLRIRNDENQRKAAFVIELRDFADQSVWKKTIEPELKKGVTTLPVDLPATDGYYELRVTPADPSFNNVTQVIPLALMYDKVDNGAEGNFGFTCHITRRERRYSFEEFDFELLKNLGVSNVRVDVGYNDVNGSQTVLKRIREAGLNPLAIITGSGLGTYEAHAKNRIDHPELVKKWAAHGIPADCAWYAEQVYNLISAYKDVVRDWEFGNEPTYWRILAEDYAQFLKAGYKAAKLADPGCNVMAGDINAIHAPVFRVKGGEFCDSIASHIYGFYVPMFWGISGKMRELNGWKNAAGIPDKPVWITEIGGCTYSSMHMIPVRTLDEVRRYQAIHQPKVMAGGMAFGASKIIPYNFRDVPLDSLEEEFGMLDRFGMPKPGAASFRATAKLLGNAKFRGFLKGHSMNVGETAGLVFKDAGNRDVIALWRNDPYGYGHFSIPFFNIIKPATEVKVKASGNGVEFFNLSGGGSTLAVKDGMVTVPVSEYPVFIRGNFAPEFEDVPVAHNIPKLNLADAAVKILPGKPTRSCDAMEGVVLELAEGNLNLITVHVYNLKSEPVSGTLRLVPRSNWREWAWKVTPAEVKLELPADGMGEGNFLIPVPRSSRPDQLYYVDAVFETAPGVQFTDTVVFRALPRQIAVNEWISYAKGVKLAPAERNSQIEITWTKERSGFISFYRKNPVAFAESAAALNRDIILPVRGEGVQTSAVSLLFMDSKGETFQLKQNLALPEKEWTTTRFSADAILKKGVIVHKGGDGKVDFPVRLLGFNFDIRGAKEDGSILVKHYETAKTAEAWDAGAWTVYGEGYKLANGKNASELVIERTPGKRYYVSFFNTRKTVLADQESSWPARAEITFRPEGTGVTAVSFLVADANGETFQLKQDIKAAPGQTHTTSFDLKRFIVQDRLVIYGGDNNKTLDYPVRLLGFNFEFARSDQPSTLTVNPPAFDGKEKENLSGGGGAVAMEQ